jgi:hypothetical protein
MVLIAEFLFVFVVIALGVRWYLRTPMHRARKNSGGFPPQVAGHMGSGCTRQARRPGTTRAARLPQRVHGPAGARHRRHPELGDA